VFHKQLSANGIVVSIRKDIVTVTFDYEVDEFAATSVNPVVEKKAIMVLVCGQGALGTATGPFWAALSAPLRDAYLLATSRGHGSKTMKKRPGKCAVHWHQEKA
jgi:hypothetical protein